MKKHQLAVFITSCLASAASYASEQNCASLLEVNWPNVEIAGSVADDQPVPHCKVTGVIDAEINFELFLPAQWNGKFVMGGGGGFVGTIDNQAMAYQPLEQGYATVGTDTGHRGSSIDATWALDNLKRQVNFGFWGVHRTTTVAKALVESHYGKASQKNYFIGCSNGGRQAMMEAQRFPDDFDGIVAMAPAMSFTSIGAHFAQIQKVMYPDPGNLSAPVVSNDNLKLVQSHIMAACDAHDGVEDGILNDPRDCNFDLGSLPLCASGQPAADCLTAAQKAALEVVYRGASHRQGVFFPGFPPGNEAETGSWDLWITGGFPVSSMPGQENVQHPSLTFAFGTEMMKYLVFNDPAWDYTRYDWNNFLKDARRTSATINAVDTDLSAFKAGGGKLILWHGWSDPALTAYDSIDYYANVEREDPAVRDYFRLFMAPGVLHCRGGPGADSWNPLAEIDRWVEQGQAPERIESYFLEEGEPPRSRPLCPYPLKAVYNTTGDAWDAGSFSCR